MPISGDPYPHKSHRLVGGNGGNLNGSQAKKPGWYSPEAAFIKVCLHEWALSCAKSDARLAENSNWSVLGIRRQTAITMIRARVKDFDAWWAASGRKDTEEEKMSQLHSRLYNMYRPQYRAKDGKKKRRSGIGSEHPTNDMKLKPYVEWAQHLYTRGWPMTTAEIRASWAAWNQ